ncbi:amidohydrolase family protein [Aminobacter sp. SR38]|jgi:cytosine/adenosine deaminase-related metal-dependent hydrolase|uniref:amidohydrolase family protein n=1 Tax=Aminobacter sp. SR38 TaxID=2774562 RepID=UPI00177E5133|nr:amidohydrolase family protein [Aminobacter sp. SR38]QOF72739.1 amidohydrolase family protein [Aminobacter sp. SR38]
MSHRTHIRNADWAVVWDEETHRHVYRNDCDVVFEGSKLIHVGNAWKGQADTAIDGRGRMIMPGFVNIHSHSRSGPIGKGIMEELATPTFWGSGLYDAKAAFWKGSAVEGDNATPVASSRLTYRELLLSGVTTVLDLSAPYESWLDIAEESGLRVVLGPWYASADWSTRNGHEVEYIWDHQAGRKHFDTAIRVIEKANAHPSGRLSGILAPDTLDTTSEDLLRDTLALGAERHWPLTIHCAESMVEFHEFTRRTGHTPVGYAKKMGVLRPGTILGHCIFLDTHSWPHWHTRDDLRSIAESKTAVAHCPTAFARGGVTMESLPDYLAAGVTVGIGTDTFPHNMIEEMRLALILARVASEDFNRMPTGEIFHLATAGGADALGRSDIGRLAVGAKADLVSVDLSDPNMRPLRDPLKSLIHCAADRAVRDVWIDGRQVVFDGKVPQIDLDAVAQASEVLEAAQRAAEATIPRVDWAKRDARALAPLSLATRR